MTTTHAAAAKEIRKELKAHGIKGRVRSRSYSMGNAVDVYLTDEMPATVAAIREFAAQYQYGSFDGMQDLYEITNRRDDLPQVKYVTVEVRYSDELKQAAYEYLRGFYAGTDHLPEAYADAHHGEQAQGEYVDVLVRKVLSAQLDRFWTARKPRVREVA